MGYDVGLDVVDEDDEQLDDDDDEDDVDRRDRTLSAEQFGSVDE